MFYIGAYLGYVADNKLRSLSGKTVTENNAPNIWEEYAKNNGTPNGNGGSGYSIWGWYQLIFIQCMYVLKYKHLNSQATIGNGCISGKINTGGTETKGMDWGTTANKTSHMKLFGIEDLWGNRWSYIKGGHITSDKKLYTSTDNFQGNTTDCNYVLTLPTFTSWSSSSKVIGTTHGGFLSINTNGSNTTYYCDNCRTSPGGTLRLSGCGEDTNIGIFGMDGDFSWTSTNAANQSTKLMYL